MRGLTDEERECIKFSVGCDCPNCYPHASYDWLYQVRGLEARGLVERDTRCDEYWHPKRTPLADVAVACDDAARGLL